VFFKVTIGICVKNGENTIGDTIKNIMEYDYSKNFNEIIFVDDGSEDNTLEVINYNIKNYDVHYRIFSSKWKGIGAARNTILNNCKSEYIVWIDDGMKIPKYYIKKLVNYMEKYKQVGQARGKWGWNKETKGFIGCLENLIKYSYEHNPNKNVGYRGIGGSISRVSALRSVNGFDENIVNSGEDIDIAIRLELARWSLKVINIEFQYKHKEHWRELLNQQIRYGKGIFYVKNKNKKILPFWTMLPIVGLIIGLKLSLIAYRSKGLKISFFLPMYIFIKRSAWLIGYILSYFTHNEHMNNWGI